MNKLIFTIALLTFTSGHAANAELTSAEISAKIAVIEKLSMDCIAVLREKGLPSEGKVWVACDRYEGRLYDFEQIMKGNPTLSEEDKKKVGYIRLRQPLIKEFSTY